MKLKSAQYLGYTLGEVLVVLMIVIILGSLGAFSFGGLRDTVLVKQGIEDIKQDLQLVQQKAMLLEKKEGENWIYGIGIDFTDISEGKYTFVKWCSPFASYGNSVTRSEILAYNDEFAIGTNDIPYGLNAYLPYNETETGGLCNRSTAIPGPSYITNMPGLEEGKLTAGFDMSLLYSDSENTVFASYVIYEAVTGRVFLYDSSGAPLNYQGDGEYIPGRQFEFVIFRNRGGIADHIKVAPLSGTVTHNIVEDSAGINILRSKMVE